MSTRIRNITGGAIALSAPYRGILGPGIGTILSDDPTAVIANLGGAFSIANVFDLGPTDEPGVAANDPSTTSSVPSYASSPTDDRPDPSTLPVGSQVFNTSDNAPNFVGADGLWHDADGNIT